jgi:membrane protein DedA with SNARE-associated domain
MDIASFVHTYGYWAVAAGTLLEGESVLVAAGFAAHRGYLDPLAVYCIAAVCSFIGDQTFFWIGRRHGRALLRRVPALGRRAEHFNALLLRYHTALIPIVRFLYGLRVAGPIALGTSGVAWPRFVALDLLGALIWAALIGALGYGFGEALSYLVGDVHRVEAAVLAGIFIAGLLVWAISRLRRRRAQRDDRS